MAYGQNASSYDPLTARLVFSTVVFFNSDPEIRVGDSSVTWIFLKKNNMMKHLTHKLTFKFQFHFLFCLAEKIIKILDQKKTLLNGISISSRQKFFASVGQEIENSF